MRRLAIPAAIVVAALALTGCSSSDDSGGDAKKATTEESPLQEYLSAMRGGEEWSEEASAKQQTEVEDLVAVCMAKEGFDYKPNVPTIGALTGSLGQREEEIPELGSVEFAETYGYGTVDWPGADEGEAEVTVDPNQAYVESLSESEQRAYNKTLSGDESGRGGGYSEDEPTEYDWRKAGCSGAAEHELQPPGLDAFSDPEFKDLFARMHEINTEISGNGETPASNEAMAKLNRKWVECMADAGYDYTDLYGPMDEFNQEFGQIVNSTTTDENGEYREQNAADFERQKKELKKLQEEEIKVAVVDATCREKIDYANEEKRITHELEQKFVEENKVQLDTMLAKYGVKKKSK